MKRIFNALAPIRWQRCTSRWCWRRQVHSLLCRKHNLIAIQNRLHKRWP